MDVAPVLIDGKWRAADAEGTFHAENPAKGEPLPLAFPISPVVVFGPNNFPFAFNGVSGGDFAAAIAAGNPVIAKAHPLHPNTTRLLAEQAFKAVQQTGLPPATVQLIYNVSNENGLKLVSDPRVGAVGFTGSRNAGLHLKRAAEDAGKPIHLRSE